MRCMGGGEGKQGRGQGMEERMGSKEGGGGERGGGGRYQLG